jgi:uridine kinase
VKAAPLIIFEGILSLYEDRFRDLMELKIFVLTDDDIRLSRRLIRDCTQRERSVEGVI